MKNSYIYTDWAPLLIRVELNPSSKYLKMPKGFLFLPFIFLSCHLCSQNLKLSELKDYTYSLEVKKESKILGYGSGFIMEKNGTYYLVTCFHLLTSKDPISNALLPQTKESPDQVAILFRSKTGGRVRTVYSLHHGTRDAYLYIPHYDIAVLPLIDIEADKLNIYSMNVNEMGNDIADQEKVVLCGFPISNAKPGTMPAICNSIITKQPTERDLDLCINTSIPEGFSGAPIYRVNPDNEIQLIGVYNTTSVSNNICKASGVANTVLRDILSFFR
jgi:hypothetical protein